MTKLFSTVALIGCLTALPALAQGLSPSDTVKARDMRNMRQLLNPKHDAGSDPVGHVTATFAASGDISNIAGTDDRACYWFQIDAAGNQWFGIPYATAGSGVLIGKIEGAASIARITGLAGPLVAFTQGGADSRCGGYPIADNINEAP